MVELVRLRDLPGMQRVVELAASRRQYDKSQRTELDLYATELSYRYFGIAQWDTYFEFDDDEGNEDQGGPDALAESEDKRFESFLQLLPICDCVYEEARSVWESLGWDISDGNGDEMRGAHLFLRQILAVEADVIDGAKFYPLGNGKSPWDENTSLEDQLNSEVDDFFRKKAS